MSIGINGHGHFCSTGSPSGLQLRFSLWATCYPCTGLPIFCLQTNVIITSALRCSWLGWIKSSGVPFQLTADAQNTKKKHVAQWNSFQSDPDTYWPNNFQARKVRCFHTFGSKWCSWKIVCKHFCTSMAKVYKNKCVSHHSMLFAFLSLISCHSLQPIEKRWLLRKH